MSRRTNRCCAAVACLIVSLVATLGAAFANDDPSLPPGTDPGGVAVALITAGIDYTRPDIASVLARDGEGDLIGWDFVDGDNRPYSKRAKENGLQSRRGPILQSPVRIVPVRIDPAMAATFTNALGFVRRTPARIVAVTTSADSAQNREMLARAATQLAELLFLVAPNPNVTRASGEASIRAFTRLPNVVVVWASQYQPDAHANPLHGGFVADAELWRALRTAACIEAELNGGGPKGGAEMKSKVLQSGVIKQKDGHGQGTEQKASPCGAQSR